MKKQKKSSQAVNFNEMGPPEEISNHYKNIDNQFGILRKIYKQWSYQQNIYTDTNIKQIMKKYLDYYYEIYDKDQFQGNLKNYAISRDQLSNSLSQPILFKSFLILDRHMWNIRFGNKFLQRFREHQQHGMKLILSYVTYLADGNFPGAHYKQNSLRVRIIDIQCAPYNCYFSIRIFNNKNLIFNVGVQRIPIMDRNKRITRYQYSSYIQFLDIVGDLQINYQNLRQYIRKFVKKNQQDSGKCDFQDDLVIDTKPLKSGYNFMFIPVKNQLTQSISIQRNQFNTSEINFRQPYIFKPTYISQGESNSLIYNAQTHRWLSKDLYFRMQRQKFNQFQQKVNAQILKKFVDFQSAKNLVELLRKIPNFKINLTQEEKNVVGQNGNVMVIGRSGTGKTTCAVLRLFAIQLLFKLRVSLNKKKYEGILKDTRFMSDDLDQTIGLHSIFVTASPVLTNEIKRYYEKLTNQIKQELDKKKKRDEQKRRLEQQQKKKDKKSKDSQIQGKQQIQQIKEKLIQHQQLQLKKQMSAEEFEENEHMKEQFQGIQIEQKLQIENQDDIQIQQFQNKMAKFSSLNDLEETDYPGFFTVRALIMMIDGTLKKPFFLRNNEKQIVGQQSKASWHNEQKGVMMIQNYYKKLQIQNQEDQAQIDQIIQEEINYSDEQQLQHQYQRQLRLRQQKNKQEFTRKIKNKSANKVSFQVDYDYFATHFWPQIKKRYYTTKNISAHMIWTQIFSTIKGSANSHLYPGCYLSQKVYLSECKNMFLNVEQKKQIYQSFCQYQRWKIKNFAYDLIDVINYILHQIRFQGYSGPSLHYLMIDQVQDLPHAIIYLLSKVAQQGVFFSGDTAQTIAKGVGFRFCDLKSMFDNQNFDTELKLQKPTVMQLTVNFRSHNNILQLANSIVSLIEILFPKTLDRLKKQRSDLKGPKPILLADSDIELLFFILCGQQLYKKQLQNTEGDLLKRPPLEFGCDQVIIVRDQQSKKKIPAILQHALCLTIYEAKGLEFNDVILFNFFSETKCQDKWNLIKFIKVLDEEMDKKQFYRSMTKHKKNEQSEKEKEKQKQNGEQPIKQQIQINCIQQLIKQDKVIIKKIKAQDNIMIKDVNDYGQLCSELKLLYTAITRPRNTLIIYDQNATHRKSIQRYWEKIEVTQVIHKQMIDSFKNQQEITNKKLRKQSESVQAQLFNSLISKTNPQEWRKQGLKMFKRKYYQQAMKCFEKSGDQILYKKSKANSLADSSTKTLIQIQSERNYIKNKLYTYANLTKSELNKVKIKLKSSQKNALKNFIIAGQLFESIQNLKQAGQCYFSGKSYLLAEKCFKNSGMHKQAGESLYMQNKYLEAAKYFNLGQDYLKSIECFDMINQWQQILKLIQIHSNKIPETQKQLLIRKYGALALQSLVYNIQFQNEQGMDKQVHQKKFQSKKPLVIQEQNSEQQSQEDYSQQENQQEDPEIQAEKQYKKKLSEQISRKNSQQVARKISNEISQNSRKISNELILTKKQSENKSSVIEVINQESRQVQQIKKKEFQSSNFQDINQSSDNIQQIKEIKQNLIKKQQNIGLIQVSESNNDSFANLNDSKSSSFADLNEPDMQGVKSIVDPADQWLKSVISQIPNKTNSEYSVIGEQKIFVSNARIIKTKGNIFVQDNVMKKIIQIVSIINNSLQNYLHRLKGHQSLITENRKDQQKIDINEFQDIDSEFICKILDTLQSFKIYKLCMFVCNRYFLPDKLGRYISSFALKYSPISQNNMTITPSLLAPSNHRKTQLEKGILASIALHALFQNINPQFLKVKINDSTNDKQSLGTYAVMGLILQGLYKKIVFIVNKEESLAILSNYSEIEMYRNIYIKNYIKEQQQNGFEYLTIAPKTELDNQLTILTLQSSIWRRLAKSHSTLISPHYIKEFNSKQSQKQYKIPNYLKYNKALWEYIELNNEINGQKLKQILKDVSIKIMPLIDGKLKLKEYQIYDLVTFVILIYNFTKQLKNTIKGLQLNLLINLYVGVKNLYFIMSNLKSNNKSTSVIIRAMLSVYQAKIIKNSKTMNIFGDSYIFVHRSSIIINELLQYRRRELIHFNSNKANQSKKFKEQIFFIQQEFNILIAPFFITFKKIRQTILKRLLEFSFVYSQIQEKDEILITMQDYIAKQDSIIFSHYMKDQEHRLRNMLDFLKITRKKQILQPDYTKVTVPNQPRTISKLPRPNMNRGMLHISVNSDEQSQKSVENYGDQIQTKYYQYSTHLYNSLFFYSKNMHPQLQNYLIERFNSLGRGNGQIFNGKYLFVSNQNKLYRQYTRKYKGYFLYDALQFKIFYRLDLYVSNILDLLDDLPKSDKCKYVQEIMILLLIHYKSTLEGKNYKVEIATNYLKYIQGIKFEEYSQKKFNQQKNFRKILNQGHSCIFSAQYKYTSEEGKSAILDYLYKYLEILDGIIEQSTQKNQYLSLILTLIFNLNTFGKMFPTINKILKYLLSTQNPNPEVKKFLNIKTQKQLLNLKNSLIEKSQILGVVLNQIRIKTVGNLEKNVNSSQIDYQKYTITLSKRLIAAKKIKKWWKKIYKAKKGCQIKQLVQKKIEQKWPIFLYGLKDGVYQDFLPKTTKLTQQLIGFYLQNIVTSSLDLHFILMTLLKIESTRIKFIQLVKSIHIEPDNQIEFQIEQYYDEISNIQKEIQIWKSDQKWILKNTTIKNRKVFQIKWLSKTLPSKIIKKRAGLKKQALLQQKKLLMKK